MPAGLGGAGREFRDLARNLRDVGEVELRKELYQAINDAAHPMVDGIRRSIGDYMPHRGGYADTLAGDVSITISKQTGTDPGVTLRGRGRSKARKVKRLEYGTLSHPLFGDREHWYSQGIRPGWFTGPANRDVPHVYDAIVEAMRRVADKATGKG